MLAFLIIVPYRGGTIHFGVLSTPIEKEKRLLISRLGGVFCAGEGTRTHTLAHQILSLACLPISTHPQGLSAGESR